MKNTLNKLENELSTLLEEMHSDKVQLFQVAFDIGKYIGNNYISNYECKPITDYQNMLEKNSLRMEREKKVGNYIEQLVLFSFKCYFNEVGDDFQLVDKGRLVKSDMWSNEIAMKSGIILVETEVDESYDKDFKLSLQATNWLSTIFKKYSLPNDFTIYLQNRSGDYYEDFSDANEIEHKLYGVCIQSYKFRQLSDEQLMSFIDEMERQMTFITLALPA